MVMFGVWTISLLFVSKNYESSEKDGVIDIIDRIKRKNHKTSDKFQDDINYQKIHKHFITVPSQNPLGSILNIKKGT